MLTLARKLVDAIPAKLARLLLLGLIVFLWWTTSAIFALRTQDVLLTQQDAVLAQQDAALARQHLDMVKAVDELAVEVRGYRADIREQNKLLREQVAHGSGR